MRDLKSKQMTIFKCGTFIHSWRNIEKPDSILIDLRSKEEKDAVRKNRFASTFKRDNCDVWRDRPQLISFERVVP